MRDNLLIASSLILCVIGILFAIGWVQVQGRVAHFPQTPPRSALELEQKLHDLDFSVEAEIRYLHERIEAIEHREDLREQAAAKAREALFNTCNSVNKRRSCAGRGCW